MPANAWLVPLLLFGGCSDVARAGVVADDPAGCLERDALVSALREVLGDRLDLIDVQGTVQAVADDRFIALQVQAGTMQWSREMQVQAVDCPHVARVAALSIGRGLAEMPGFDWDVLLGVRPPVRLGAVFGVSVPAPRLHVALRGAAGKGIRAAWSLRVEGSPAWRDDGSRIFDVTAGLGPALAIEVGKLELRPELDLNAGPLWVFSENQGVPSSIGPIFYFTVGAGLEVGAAGPWTGAFHVEVPGRQIILLGDDGAIVGLEPKLRALVSVGFVPNLTKQ